MADTLHRSRYRLTYIHTDDRTGARHRFVLCRIGSLLSSPVTLSGQPVIQSDSIVGADWVRLASRGNAAMTLAAEVLTVWTSTLAAEQYGHDLHQWMLMHPVGKLLVESCPDYKTGEPTRVQMWTAAMDTAGPSPMTRDIYAGPVAIRTDAGATSRAAAWLQMSYKFRLTRPQPDVLPLPSDTINDILL